MPFEAMQNINIIETMVNYIEKIRPPENIRDQVDIGYRQENLSIFIFEIRPHFELGDIMELDYAKATYVKSKNHWKVFWMRGNGDWDSYPLCPTVKTLEAFLKLVDEDEAHCFKG